MNSLMHATARKRVAVMMAGALLAGLAFVGTAFADPPPAPDPPPGRSRGPSCMGREAAAISPPGSSTEVAGGMPELGAFIRSLPGPPGQTTREIAGLHEPSHEACDEALE